MNEHLINEDSTIYGESKKHLPNDVIYHTNKEDFIFKNCVVVFSFLNLDRFNFKVAFYEKFTQKEFKSTDRHHLCYIIKTTEENSKAIIDDIQKGVNFMP